METSGKEVSVISHQEGQGELSRKKTSIREYGFHLLSLKSLSEHSALITLNQWVSLAGSEKEFTNFKTSQKISILNRPFQPDIKS